MLNDDEPECCGDLHGKCPARFFCLARNSRRRPRIRLRAGPRRGRLPKHLKEARERERENAKQQTRAGAAPAKEKLP